MKVRYCVIVTVVLASAFVFSRPAGAQTKALLLFGDEDHRTFLGCLNCSSVSPSSVCNTVGKYGSSIQSDSIWNSIGKFGSSIQRTSPWNTIASDPPIIVDKDGNSYGYFTANEVHAHRSQIPWIEGLLKAYAEDDDLDKIQEKFCEE